MTPIVHRRATAQAFHDLPIPDPAGSEIWLHDVEQPALVLGSTQSEDVVDRRACDRAGIQIARRRSGGGAVLLLPGTVTWIDVIVPAGTSGWADDVHGPMRWLGDHLRAAFADAWPDGPRIDVHDGALVETPFSRLICFDGIGPGELTIGGAKLVGISQRRVRAAARLQCCWYTEHDPALLPSLLRSAPEAASLRPVAVADPVVAGDVVHRLAARVGGSSGD